MQSVCDQQRPGPSCKKLMMSLRNVSLKFQTFISQQANSKILYAALVCLKINFHIFSFTGYFVVANLCI